jgi:hypothetical protein
MFDMMSRWGVVLVILVSGCAAYEPPTPGPDHPAHPQAAAPRHHLVLSTLEIDGANLPAPPPELNGTSMESMSGGPMSESAMPQEQE